MGNRLLRQVDRTTGEILEDGCLVYVPHRPRFREAFVMLWQDALKRLAEEGELGSQHWRVLIYLMGKLDYENYIHVSQADIARGIRMDRGDVSRVMADFVKRGLLVQGPRVGRSYTYRMSSSLGWKGRVKTLQEQRRGHLRDVRGGKPSAGGKGAPRRS